MTRLNVLFVAALLVAISAFAMRSPVTILAQTPVDAAARLQEVVDAINRGDLDDILTFFADDAVIEGEPDCTTPCTGSDGLRREFGAVVAANVHVTLTDVQVTGNSASSRFEATSSFLTQGGFQRIVGSFTIELRGDKIASSTFVIDATDPETARFLALYPGLTTSGQTVLPGTGSGPSAGEAAWAGLAGVLAVLGVLGVVGGLGAIARSRRGRSPR